MGNQQDICEKWVEICDPNRLPESPLVSVVMITYNHQEFLREAIDGVLMQQTDFDFELIIGEDSSSDGTREIAQEYQKKNPNLIRLVCSGSNAGMTKNLANSLQSARGEYIAICEGDDYWTDSRKLQIQVEALMKHKGVDICFHPATELHNGERGRVIAKHSEIDKVFSIREVIVGDGAFCPTASLMLRREVIPMIPDWFSTAAPVGDCFLQIYGSLRGGAFYINRNMSVYRMNAPGSWTHSTRDIKKQVVFIDKHDHALMCFANEYHEYKPEIEIVIQKHCLVFLKTAELDNAVKGDIYSRYKRHLSVKQKTSWLLIYRYPKIYAFLSKLRQTIKHNL